MSAIQILVSTVGREDNLAIVPLEEGKLVRGAKFWRKEGLQKNVGKRKNSDKQEEGSHKMVKKAYSFLPQ